MISKYSIASKARWAKIPSADRTKIMKGLATSAWAKLTPEQKSERAKRAAKTRLTKKKNKNNTFDI